MPSSLSLYRRNGPNGCFEDPAFAAAVVARLNQLKPQFHALWLSRTVAGSQINFGNLIAVRGRPAQMAIPNSRIMAGDDAVCFIF
jgi:hypothetical protein